MKGPGAAHAQRQTQGGHLQRGGNQLEQTLAPAARLRLQVGPVGICRAVGVLVMLPVVHRLPEARGHPGHAEAEQSHQPPPFLAPHSAAMHQVMHAEPKHKHAVAHDQGQGQPERQPERRPLVQSVGHLPAQQQDRPVDRRQGQLVAVRLERLSGKQRPQLAGQLQLAGG